MFRQISRLILYLLVRVKNFVCKHPGAFLGFVIGAVIGYVLSISMIRHGFPKWILPVQTLMWAIALAPIVKNYLDKLTK